MSDGSSIDGEDKCWSSTQREYAADLYDGLITWLQTQYGSKKAH